MSNKHTPGPWEWDGDPTNYDKKEEAPWLLANAGLTQVLSGEIEAHNKADVKLIAAAPELLRALQAFVEHAKYHDIPVGSGIWVQIKDAIALATGGEPTFPKLKN